MIIKQQNEEIIAKQNHIIDFNNKFYICEGEKYDYQQLLGEKDSLD